MPRRNNRARRNGVRNGNRSAGGPTPAPKRCLSKKLQYTESVNLNNSTNDYAYYSKFMKPDVTKCIGALAQFDAYELWRLKKIRVSIQAAAQIINQTSSASPLNTVANTVVWTAADFGNNESVSGTTIMQYQNAKRNTLSLNKWTPVVNTASKINAKLQGSNVYSFIMPSSTWVNTTEFNSDFYSGYQLFIQSFGAQTLQPGSTPAYTIQTELEIEFMQPAFQNTASSFTSRIFDVKLTVIPDGSDPDVTRDYIFERVIVEPNSDGEREYKVLMKRADGQPGNITYTSGELLTVYEEGKSGQYFGNRRAIYDGPVPEQFRLMN